MIQTRGLRTLPIDQTCPESHYSPSCDKVFAHPPLPQRPQNYHHGICTKWNRSSVNAKGQTGHGIGTWDFMVWLIHSELISVLASMIESAQPHSILCHFPPPLIYSRVKIDINRDLAQNPLSLLWISHRFGNRFPLLNLAFPLSDQFWLAKDIRW